MQTLTKGRIEQITEWDVESNPALKPWLGWWRALYPLKKYGYNGAYIQWLPLFYSESETQAREQLKSYEGLAHRGL